MESKMVFAGASKDGFVSVILAIVTASAAGLGCGSSRCAAGNIGARFVEIRSMLGMDCSGLMPQCLEHK
jgi:hypothetical protein